jgi:hypothetical protein
MNIEDRLDKLTAAIEQLTTALVKLPTPSAASAAEKPKAKTKTEVPAPAVPAESKAPNNDDIRAAAQKLLDYDSENNSQKGLTFLQGLKKELGCKASDAPADKVVEVLAKINAELEKLASV